MGAATAGDSLNLDARLSRSRGRSSRTYVASAKVTKAEQRELEMAAQMTGKALSEWAREVLLREARGSRADALFTEVVAMRMMLNKLLRPLTCGEAITPDDFTTCMATIRTTKQKVAQEIMQQYLTPGAKE
jgi:hypothetical protein